MRKLFFCLMLWVIITPSQARANFEDLRLLFGSFASDIKFSPYYGTLTMVAADRSYLYYVTNSHALPPDVDMHDSMTVDLEVKGQRASAQLIHNAPGYDLAIFRVRRLDTDYLDFRALNELLTQAWEHDINESSEPVHFGIIGVAGKVMKGQLTYRNLTWFDEWDMTMEQNAPFKLLTYTVRQRPRHLSLDKIELNHTHDCPPAFVDECIRLPMRSWGYSGGAMLASYNQRIDNKTRIGGLVSYFGPLSDKTLVIPAPVVYDAALCMLKMKGCSAQPEYFNQNGSIRFLSAGCYELKSGDFKGKLLRSLMVNSCSTRPSSVSKHMQRYPLIAVGGGGSMGGGGGSMGGGGGSMGGGGELRSRLQFKKNRRLFLTDHNGNVTGLGDFDRLIEESKDPASWCKSDSHFCTFLKQDPWIRGVDIFLNYRSGFAIDGQRYDDYTLTQFLSCYSKSGSSDCLRKPINHLGEIPWEELEIDANTGYGMASNRYLFRLKTANELIRDENNGRVLYGTATEMAFTGILGRLENDTTKFKRQYNALNAAGRRANAQGYRDTMLYDDLDVITDRSDGLWPYTPVNHFEAKREGNSIFVTWGIGRAGEEPYKNNFEAEIISEIRKPDYIKMIVNLPGENPDMPVKGIFIVSYDKSRDLYEVRLISSATLTLETIQSLFAGKPNRHERKILTAIESILRSERDVDPSMTLDDLFKMLEKTDRLDSYITAKELEQALMRSVKLSDTFPLNRLDEAFEVSEYIKDFAEAPQQNDRSTLSIDVIYFPLKRASLNEQTVERSSQAERLSFFTNLPDAPRRPEVTPTPSLERQIKEIMEEIAIYLRR